MPILDDDQFVLNGGLTGTTTAAQRQIAYTIAESQIEEYLGYPLLRRQFTHDYFYPIWSYAFPLDHMMVHTLDYVATISPTGTHDVQEELVNVVFLVNNEKGIIEIPYNLYYGRTCLPGIRLTYTAGMETGTFNNDARGMMALTMASQLILNEMVAPGTTETILGIQEFTNMHYTEKRFPLYATVFGSSPVANYIRKLLSHLKISRVGRI